MFHIHSVLILEYVCISLNPCTASLHFKQTSLRSTSDVTVNIWSWGDSESVKVSQAWWLSMNWKQGWSGLFSSPHYLCLSVHSKSTVLLIQQGNSYCAAGLWKPLAVWEVSGHFDLDHLDFSCLSMCVRYLYVGVENGGWIFPSGSHRHLNNTRIHDWVKGASVNCSPLFCCWLEHKRAFLSCESEDKGHWLHSKLALDPLWFRGLYHVCTHMYRHIMHHQSSEKRPPIYLSIFI